MNKRIILPLMLGLSLSVAGCQFINRSGSEDIETASEEVVVEPQFALLNEGDKSLYFEDVSASSDTSLWLDRTITYPSDVDTISQEILCSTVWNYDPLSTDAVKLVFYVDDAFIIGSTTEGPEIMGNYEIVNDTEVKLYNIKYSGLEDYYDSARKEITLVFESNADNLFYSNQLIDKTTEQFYGASNGESTDDRAYAIGDINVIKDSFTGITTERLMFRNGPATSYQSIRVNYGSQINTSDGTFNNFLKGTEINVWARTVNKEVIGDMEDYWYFISYSSNNESTYGWVYGAYVESYTSVKNDEYKATFSSELESINGSN